MEIPIRRRFQDGLHHLESYCIATNLDYAYLAWLPDGSWKVFATEDSITPKKNTKFWKVSYLDAKTRTSGLINDLLQSLQLLKF